MNAFTYVTLRYPDRSIPIAVSPTRSLIEEVLRNPADFGDNGEIGGLQMEWEEEIPGQDDEVTIVDPVNPPLIMNLHFYLGVPGYAMIFYTHTGNAIYERVVGPGITFKSGTIRAMDLGASEMELQKINLLTIEEALDVAMSFIENEGELDIVFNK